MQNWLKISIKLLNYVTIAKAKNANIYPLYRSLVEAKNRCNPSDSAFKITEDSVRISTQALMDYTASRLLQISDILPLDITEKQNVLMTLISEYGFDGTSRHNSYNQALVQNQIEAF